MNRSVITAAVLALSVVAAVPAFGQSGGTSDTATMKRHDMSAMNGTSPTAKQVVDGVGVVKSVDVQKGTVTLQHEAIPSIGWAPMIMTFTAPSKVLGQVKPGDKVRFQLQESPSKNGTYVVTSMRQ